MKQIVSLDMPENLKSSAVYRDNQVIIEISTEKVFPILKCNETIFEVSFFYQLKTTD